MFTILSLSIVTFAFGKLLNKLKSTFSKATVASTFSLMVFKTKACILSLNRKGIAASAVIDKDFASALLAKELDADFLIILTAVEKVALNYGKPDEKWLDDVTVEEAKQYVEEGHFAPGSMLPKVQAALDFAESKPGRQSLITLLEKAKDGILGETGTRIHL